VVSDGKHWTTVKLVGGWLSGDGDIRRLLRSKRKEGCGAASLGGGGEAPVGDRDLHSGDDVRWRRGGEL
jgi:hypothetical protein